ncbi:hypothetical protein VTN31DRAFT_3253 [Thermomyces dupontii]|uniref:uncharacterized protein n=1 Tax=Talaromyces thermophilus TaxID=28565 RepID=UPI003744651D
MSLPKPPSPLNGHCSVVYNNTLYVYMPESFMSLPLRLRGNWTTLDRGEPVRNARCILGGKAGDPSQSALYVVGGTSDSADYPGLQMYSFADAKWETIKLPTMDLHNRVNHGAAYLEGSSSIVVYAGSTDGSTVASTGTFTVSLADQPYVVDSWQSQGAPAALNPALFTWDDNAIVLLGGGPTSNQVFLFSIGDGWRMSGVTLTEGLPSSSGLAFVNGEDGSKVLEIFDMGTVPNKVDFIPLVQPNGEPAQPGQQIEFKLKSDSKSLPKLRKRLSGLSNFPAYDGTLAPNITRDSFSIAQSDDGLVVISGGSTTEPVAIFNQTDNSWVNTTQLFFGDNTARKPVQTTSTPATITPTATTSSTTSSTASASVTPGAGFTSSPDNSTGLIIGATLGSLAGFGALLAILLVVLRVVHRERERQSTAGTRGTLGYDRDRAGFQDPGIEPLAKSAAPMAMGPVTSVDSLDILSGKAAGGATGNSPAVVDSNNRVLSRPLIPQQMYGQPPTVASSQANVSRSDTDTQNKSSMAGQVRGDRTTDEGWSKYFQDGVAGNRHSGKESARSSQASDLSEESRADNVSNEWPQVRTTPALAVDRVTTGNSSTERLPVAVHGTPLPQGQSAQISHAESTSFVSEYDESERRETYASVVPSSVCESPETWQRLSRLSELRPTSSNYSNSVYRSSNLQPFQGDVASQTNTSSDMSWLDLKGGR